MHFAGKKNYLEKKLIHAIWMDYDSTRN